MKKVFILLFIVMAGLLYSAPVSMDYSVELGWVPKAAFGGYETIPIIFRYDGNYEIPHDVKGYEFWNSFYTELKTKIWLWDTIFAGGGITVQIHNDGLSFDPDFTNYNFIAGVKWNNIEVFYSHDCTHPQMTYNEFYRVTSLWGEGSLDKFAIRFSNR